MIKKWLAKLLEEMRVLRVSETANNLEIQIREQLEQHYHTRIAEREYNAFKEGESRTREAYKKEFDILRAAAHQISNREWIYDRVMKHGDSVQDNTGKVFTLHECKNDEGITQKPKRIQRRKTSRKGKRV